MGESRVEREWPWFDVGLPVATAFELNMHQYKFSEVKMKIDVPAPPCSRCKYWNPLVTYRDFGDGKYQLDGYQMCNSLEQYRDFSCFRAKASDD